ncbi:MAG: IS630 family transposase, partial [Methanoregula sp.]
LNIAEIELSALSRQSLDRRIDNLDTLVQETKRWESARNKNQNQVDWQFTSEHARIKLKRLYPQF